MKISHDISLKPFHTFGTEVKASCFAEVSHREEILQFFREELRSCPKPLLILGGGSNLLFTKDFSGTVLKISTQGIRMISENSDQVLVQAEAGEPWDEFVDFCVAQNLGGLENLSMIPGQVGTCPVQNIGAYGREIKDCFHSLEALDLQSLETIAFTEAECKFAYRDSVFKNELRGRYLILSVTFALVKNAAVDVSYGNIAAELKSVGCINPGISDVASAVRRIRTARLPDPKILGNAGSFFKNPLVTAFDYYRLKEAHPQMPSYNQDDGYYKIPAAWLIEQCGWKGFRRGDAGVHKEQALILVNYGNATGNEIMDLAQEIMDSVKSAFDVSLQTEVNII